MGKKALELLGLVQSEAEVPEKLGREILLYLEPPKDWPDEKKAQFAQCGTCKFWTGEAQTCNIHGPRDVLEVAAADTCYLYVPGLTPHEPGHEEVAVTPDQSGFVKDHKSRCENCRSFNTGVCDLMKLANEKMPEVFEMNTQVQPLGCCNGQENK